MTQETKTLSFLRNLGEGAIQEGQLVRDDGTGKVYRLKKLTGIYFRWDKSQVRIKGRFALIEQQGIIKRYKEEHGAIARVWRIG